MQSLELTVSAPALGATFTWPESPRAAALILQGSGLHDRDGAMRAFNFPSTLYKRLARELCERCGMATLRYDKRGSLDSADALHDYSVRSRLDDAKAALIVASRRPEIAGLPLLVIGHSEGAMIAAKVALEEPGLLRGVVSLAAPFGNVFELNKHRAQRLAEGPNVALHDKGRRALEFYAKLQTLFVEGTELSPADFRTLALPYQDAGFAGWESFQWLLEHWQGALEADPTRAGLPVLVVQGGRDNRLWHDNTQRWREWCTTRAGTTFVELPDMGHDLNDARRKAFVLHEELIPTISAWLEHATGRT